MCVCVWLYGEPCLLFSVVRRRLSMHPAHLNTNLNSFLKPCRVSLRCLAEKQILAWLLGLYFVLLPIVKWLFSALFLGSSATAQ